MAGVIYRMDGLRQFQDVRGAIPKALKDPIARANRDTATAIRTRAQSFAPRDKGDLIKAIAAQGTASGLTWRVGLLDLTIPSRGGRNSAHQNPSVYGVWYEYGFVHRKIAAHPFMRRAAQAEEPRYQERIDAVGRELEQAVPRVP